MLARLEKAAEKNERTLNGEIVRRLEESFKREEMQGYIDATAQKIAEKVLLFAHAGPDPEMDKVIEDALFELDLKGLSEMFPDTPKEKLAQSLIDRRAALQAKRK